MNLAIFEMTTRGLDDWKNSVRATQNGGRDTKVQSVPAGRRIVDEPSYPKYQVLFTNRDGWVENQFYYIDCISYKYDEGGEFDKI